MSPARRPDMKSKKKLLLSILLMLAVAMSLAVTTYAKAKPQLSGKTLTINVGESAKLTLINAKRAKWTSSNKKVAGVKRGLVVGKKPGKAVITAQVGKKKLKCKVTVVSVPVVQTYVCNTNTMKFHYITCRSVAEIYPENRFDTTEPREAIIAKGFVPCKICNP